MTPGHGASQILQVIFGQELPDTATSFAQQSFAVGVAAIGLAAFALVLALVEQVWRPPCTLLVLIRRRPVLPAAPSNQAKQSSIPELLSKACAGPGIPQCG